jgi:RNA polymerase sigma-70 factor (ECF subfamily)
MPLLYRNFAGVSVDATRTSATEQGLGELDFQGLVETYYAGLYRFALSLARSEDRACDLVQDTFLKWASKGHQLRDPKKVKAWLYTTIHRRFLEGQRRSSRFPEVEIMEAAPELPNVEPSLANQLDGQSVLALLNQLDPQFQAALALFYLEDYSYQEIAEVLGVPLGTVKSRIARGLKQLKVLVNQEAAPVNPSEEGPS